MNIVQIYKRFPTETDCIKHLELVRWQDKPVCPYCKSSHCTSVPNEGRHHCNKCNTSFCVTVGTIFHNTKLDLQKWFLAVTLILNAKKGISARQLARDLEVSKDTAWRIGMQVRKAMGEYGDMLKGVVEMDETYIGGKPRGNTPEKKKRGRGTDKQPVIGMVERNGNIKAQTVPNVTADVINSLVKENVEIEGSTIISDEFRGYSKLVTFIAHLSINHSKEYVRDNVHTNTIEGFWSLLKRGIIGQYHKVSIKYLDQYINEFCFRYNGRKEKAIDLFDKTLLKSVNI